METNEVATQSEFASTNLRQLADLPAPKGLPFLGNALQIKGHRLHQQFEQWSREYGSYFRVKIGARKLLIVADHQAFAKILRDRPDGFSRTVKLAETWREMGLQVGLFGANGEVWKRQRRMVMAGFDPAHVKAYFPAMCKVTDRLESRWKKSIGTEIDLQADLMRFTVDTITGLAFGHDVNTLESGDDVIQRHLDKIFPAVFKRNLAVFKYWKYFRLPSDRELERSVAEVNVAIEGFVKQARERIKQVPTLRENPTNLLEAMINAADLGDSGLNDTDVAGNVLTMLLAGEDTTANSIAWLLELLWKNPAALQQLQEEVRGKFALDTPYSTENLNELDYLDACINEAMRLKPVAPLLPLQATKDTVIGDIHIPTGTIVFGLFRRDSVDDNFIPNAAQFDPQRWLSNGETGQAINSVKRISMPFGAGPRICPGRYLALLEMKIAMVMLLTRFDIDNISTPNGQDAEEHLAFTMAPLGLKMRLKLRN
ncbi:cytochrome P450 [Solimicrobium silvestre]|uniref:Cytochrome P450 n=1 Tax=Solimicrobium silvestre TaxID=2099400 RepID=A0A2S9H2L4_9BURK|nr:cytochrome P450 [Solimicrobium silvestre]PRC94106.1 Cytochrome P450 [Solimicrobium silvestre]